MPKDPRSYLQRAEDHRRHGRLKEAIAACREALAEHPSLDAARITLGRALLESGDASAAAETLSEVFARLPEHHLAGRTLAEAQRRLHDFAGAEQTCRGLLEHYPRDREIEPLLAEILEEKNGAAGATASTVAPPAPARAAPARVVSAPAPTPSAPIPVVAAPAPTPAAPAKASPKPAPAPPSPAPAPRQTIPVAVAAPAPDPEPEYSPEDVDVTTPPRSVNVGQSANEAAAKPNTAEAGRTEPKPVSPAPRAARAEGDALATNTLAELYLRQGMTDRAVAVYRNMLRVEPGNAAVRRRLAEIEGRQETAPPAAAIARPAVPPMAMTTPPTAARMAPPAPAPAASAPQASFAVAPSTQAAHAAMGVAAPPLDAPPAIAAPAPGMPPRPVVETRAVAAAAPRHGLAPADKAAVERLERWLKTIEDGSAADRGATA